MSLYNSVIPKLAIINRFNQCFYIFIKSLQIALLYFNSNVCYSVFPGIFSYFKFFSFVKNGKFAFFCFSISVFHPVPLLYLLSPSYSKLCKPLLCSCCQIFSTFLAVIFDTYNYSKFFHDRLLVSRLVRLVVRILSFRLQIGWLSPGISSSVDEKVLRL